MSPLLIALTLAAAQPAADAASATAEPQAPAARADYPPGAPRDDYQFTAWCYGALRGYLELHDQVMPEVTRIEGAYRRPGSRLADDLKVYADMRREGRTQLKIFQSAMTAAEKASLRPLNAQGAEALRKGRATWTAGPTTTKARLAQEWMSWTLPARCEIVARDLEQRSNLLAATLKANAPADDLPAADPSPSATP